MHFTEQHVLRELGQTAFGRGQEYFRQGRVLNLLVTAGGARIQGSVQGSRQESYKQNIVVSRINQRVMFAGQCTCPMAINCKHVAAVLLAAWERVSAEPVEPAEEKTLLPELSVPLIPLTMVWSEWIKELALANQPKSERASEYSRDVAERLLYVLKLRQVTHRATLIVELMQARLLKTGALGKPAPINNPNDLLVYQKRYVLPVDQAIVRALLVERGISWQREIELHGETGVELLRKILATGRCFWLNNKTAALRLGSPRRAVLQWQVTEHGKQRLQFVSEPPAWAMLPLAPPWYIDIAASECGELETAYSPGLAEVLANSPQLEASETEFLSRALSAQTIVPIPAPQIIAVRTLYETKPIPCLTLSQEPWAHPTFFYSPKWQTQAIDMAQLSFYYAGLKVAFDDPSKTIENYQAGEMLRCPRHEKAEQKALRRLDSIGFEQVDRFSSPKKHEGGRFILEDENAWLNFVIRDLPKLKEEGWQIVEEPSFSFRLAKTEAWYAEIAETTNQWFDLELGIEVDGQKVPLLPILVEAIKQIPARERKERLANDHHVVYFRLPDGRLLPISATRLRPILATLTELFDDKRNGPRLRLSTLDAARLADLNSVLTPSWLGGERLLALGQKLRDFSGIKSVAAPRELRTQLRNYQLEGLAWLQFLREYELAGILADDMGLGKTIQALAHILLEKETGRMQKPALVIAPTSLMHNWKSETERFAPQLKVLVLQGINRKHEFQRIAEHDLVLSTYALLSRDEEVLLKTAYHLLILDEAQNIKNASTKAATIASKIAATHRLCLTGTPLENHLGELWSLMHVLMPGFLGDAPSFRRLYRTPIEKHGDPERREALVRRVKPFILRRTKEQVAPELPPKTEILKTVEFEGAQRDLYETIRIAMHERVQEEIARKGLAQSHIIILDALLKLRQVCCDPRLLKLDAAKKVSQSAKLGLLLEVLPEMLEEGRRVLLFSQFTSMLALIEKELVVRSIAYAKLTGDTVNREQPIAAFQTGKVPLFLISLKAGGTGLNLTAADTVIHYDPWWNPAVENQATDRAHRIGQDKPVFVYKFIVSGSVEEKIMALQARKAALAAGILAGENTAASSLTTYDLAALFEPLASNERG